jgi:hypothetical protein
VTAAYVAVALVVGYFLGAASTRAVWRRAVRSVANSWREAAALGDAGSDVSVTLRSMAAVLDGMGGKA